MKSHTIRQFNASGVERFRSLLENRPEDHSDSAPFFESLEALLTDSEYSTDLKIEFDFSLATRRIDLARQLLGPFGVDGDLRKYVNDDSLWAWVAARYLSELCNSPEGYKQIHSTYRWIPIRSTFRYHRHLIIGVFLVANANAENLERAMCALCTPILAPGDVVERVTGKVEMLSGNVMGLATRLFYDPVSGQNKKGASSKWAQSLSIVLNQFDVTLDYEQMTLDDLVAQLPDRFDRWLK